MDQNYITAKKRKMEAKQLTAIQDFENMKDWATLRALSKASLERPLTDEEYQKMMKLKEKLELIT